MCNFFRVSDMQSRSLPGLNHLSNYTPQPHNIQSLQEHHKLWLTYGTKQFFQYCIFVHIYKHFQKPDTTPTICAHPAEQILYLQWRSCKGVTRMERLYFSELLRRYMNSFILFGYVLNIYNVYANLNTVNKCSFFRSFNKLL